MSEELKQLQHQHNILKEDLAICKEVIKNLKNQIEILQLEKTELIQKLELTNSEPKKL